MFPIYNAMAEDAKPSILVSVLGGITFTMVAYTTIACISIAYFSSDSIEPSIFENLVYDRSWSSITL
jgi:hypothetical protein